jgi:hypothetical protein
MNQTRGNSTVSAWTLLALLVALAAMGMVVYLLFELQQYRATTAELLKTVSGQVNGLTQNDMVYTVKIDQTIPFSATVPINQDLAIPVKFELNDTFPLQAVIPLNTKINLPITTTIPVNQKFNVSLNILGQDVALPVAIQGSLPVDVNLDVPFKQDVAINARVPVKLPIDTTVKINLSQNIPIQSQVPIKMEVPIKVSVKDLVGVADLSAKLDAAANNLTSGPSPLVIAGILLAFLVVSVVILVIFFATRQSPASYPLPASGYSENAVPPEQNRNNRP